MNSKIKEFEVKALDLCKPVFKKLDKLYEYNQTKVLNAFLECKVSESHFCATTGYGYNDVGRDVLDNVFSKIFKTEDALVRHNFVSGTHAICTALFGVLRPGDILISATGKPYDTLLDIMTGSPKNGNLKDFGINYKEIPLNADGSVDLASFKKTLLKNDKIKVVYIQRSRGYSLRPSLAVDEIQKIVELTKSINSNIITCVDNCYGEFVEEKEPTQVGADLIVGSLIKNPGAGIATTGGYIAGKKHLVRQCAQRLFAPGVAKEIAPTLGLNKELFMGVFNAPLAVNHALKSAIYSAALFEILGFQVSPLYNHVRTDIVQTITLKNKQNLLSFCQGLQSKLPIDSYLTPEPWDMPGYNHQVIMCSGGFVSGSSIELSADAPIKEPFCVFLQGGTNFVAAKHAINAAANRLVEQP